MCWFSAEHANHVEEARRDSPLESGRCIRTGIGQSRKATSKVAGPLRSAC